MFILAALFQMPTMHIICAYSFPQCNTKLGKNNRECYFVFYYRTATEPSPPCSSNSPHDQLIDGHLHHWNQHRAAAAIMGLSSDLPSNGNKIKLINKI